MDFTDDAILQAAATITAAKITQGVMGTVEGEPDISKTFADSYVEVVQGLELIGTVGVVKSILEKLRTR
jgi:hypothetical protein